MVPPFVQAVQTPIPEFLFIGTIRFISILVITFLQRLCEAKKLLSLLNFNTCKVLHVSKELTLLDGEKLLTFGNEKLLTFGIEI